MTMPQAAARAQDMPPPVRREFRGVWVATVANIDWPSQPGLPVEQQKAEMIALLDRCVALNLNAVVFQVRPATDALYASTLEPWSEYLTGTMGKAPEPFYDPLQFVIEESHRRGLELHAWFNPFRARQAGAKSPISPDHISQTHPELVRTYGKLLWMDPGEEAARAQTLAVMLDVVRRYDVDGIHLDDYFYPYKENDAAGNVLNFPDDPSWNRYVQGGGRLGRDDWRRSNINTLIESLYKGIKAEKRWVKFGISPFGIWRPGNPTQIKGFDAYAELYADARLWLREGWVDYFTPQLYWQITPPAQSYPALLSWWVGENVKGRNMWPGNYTGRWPADEMVAQVEATRTQNGATGNVHFSMKSLMGSGEAGDKGARLRETVYAEPALVPASPWLDAAPPAKPASLTATAPRSGEAGVSLPGLVTWSPGSKTAPAPWLYLVQARSGGVWRTVALVPGAQTACPLPFTSSSGEAAPDAVAVSAVSRNAVQSQPLMLPVRPAAR